MNISTENFEFEAEVKDDVTHINGVVTIAEENAEKCTAQVAYFAADVKLLVFTRSELLKQMYAVLAKAARVNVDGVSEIEFDIDDVRNGAAMADFVEYFEL